ncbi:MAG: LysM peptidoglycan-binding domain-containing protein [Thermosulfidibacteraceae bacterium]|jgi:hypothetical protein
MQKAIVLIIILLIPYLSFGEVLYKVKRGDTLWNLSERFYGSNQYWYFIWERNKKVIKNPHWIYPGMKIVIPDKEVLERGIPIVSKEIEELKVREPVLSFDEIASSIYYSKNLKKDGAVKEALDGETVFGGEMPVYAEVLSGFSNVERGDLLRVVKPERFKDGYILNSKAILQVDEVLENKEGKRLVKCNIVKNYSEVESGDLVYTMEDLEPIYDLKMCDSVGRIVYISDKRDMAMDFDRAIVEFDRDVEAGCFFDVCDKYGDLKGNAISLQGGKIVGVMIRDSSKEILIGDTVKGHGRCR